VRLHHPVGKIDVNEYNTVSWADLERDPSAWLDNPMQTVSYEFLKGLAPFVRGFGDESWLRFWRYFQMSDHLYYMSVKGGGPGDVHCYFNPSGNPLDAFVTFSNVISDFEARILQELQKPELKAKWILRRLPTDHGFTFFHAFARPTTVTAHDLVEFAAALSKAPVRSVQYHVERGDFERWISQVLGDNTLAEQLASLAREGIPGERLRKRLIGLVKTRVKQLQASAAEG
jgi:alpha-amylase